MTLAVASRPAHRLGKGFDFAAAAHREAIEQNLELVAQVGQAGRGARLLRIETEADLHAVQAEDQMRDLIRREC